LIDRIENKNSTNNRDSNESANEKKLSTKLLFALIEGATLFASYEGSISLLDVDILPSAPDFIKNVVEQRWF